MLCKYLYITIKYGSHKMLTPCWTCIGIKSHMSIVDTFIVTTNHLIRWNQWNACYSSWEKSTFIFCCFCGLNAYYHILMKLCQAPSKNESPKYYWFLHFSSCYKFVAKCENTICRKVVEEAFWRLKLTLKCRYIYTSASFSLIVSSSLVNDYVAAWLKVFPVISLKSSSGQFID